MKIVPLSLSLAVTLAFTAQLRAGEPTLQVWSSPVAASSDILTPETFKQFEKQDVAGALAIVPGVTLDKSGNRNEMLVRVRGFNSKQVPVYYDGVPIYIPYDGNLDLSRFLTSGLASLEVSKGYTSLLQGPNQLGGSINLITQQPKKPLEGSISYRQGWSQGERNARDREASLGMKADSGFLQLNGSQLTRDFTGLAHDVSNPVAGINGKRSNSASDDKRGMIKLGWTPRESDEYLFSWISQQGNKNSPPYAGTAAMQPRYWQWPEYDKQSLYYQGMTVLGENFTLKSRAFHDTFKNTLLMYNSAAALRNKQGSYSHYDDSSNGASLQLAASVRDSDILSLAAHWKDDVHREQGYRKGPVDRYADRTWSLATEYQWMIGEALEAVAGVSYDWRQSLEGLKHERNGTLTRYDDNRQQAFNWQTLVKYHFDGGDTLSFSLADRTRFPTQKERYTTSRPAYALTALVNPHLQPERARIIDLSWSGALGEFWRYEIGAYYNHLTNTILSHDIDAQTVQNRNSGEVNYRGLDVGLNGTLGEKARAGLNYGLINYEVKQRAAGTITGLPRQTMTAWLTITALENWSITLTEQARSASYSNSSATRKAAGYAISHLRMDLQLGKGFSVNAAVQNLFDKGYALTEGFDESGRQYWAGLEYRF